MGMGQIRALGATIRMRRSPRPVSALTTPSKPRASPEVGFSGSSRKGTILRKGSAASLSRASRVFAPYFGARLSRSLCNGRPISHSKSPQTAIVACELRAMGLAGRARPGSRTTLRTSPIQGRPPQAMPTGLRPERFPGCAPPTCPHSCSRRTAPGRAVLDDLRRKPRAARPRPVRGPA